MKNNVPVNISQTSNPIKFFLPAQLLTPASFAASPVTDIPMVPNLGSTTNIFALRTPAKFETSPLTDDFRSKSWQYHQHLRYALLQISKPAL